MNKVKTESTAEYTVSVSSDDDNIIQKALEILESRIRVKTNAMTSPDTVKQFLGLKLQLLEHEVFSVLFLDNQHFLISYEEVFRGTIDGASVYPREIVKAALKHNAAAVILAHNHPSGITTPSNADKQITDKLKSALSLIDIRVLDHIIVGDSTYSFAEAGLI